MRLHRIWRTAVATAAAVVLLADAAGAHTGHTATFTASTYALNADATYTVGFTFGAMEVDRMEIDFSPGFKFAHHDSYGNELPSNPDDEDVIGSGSLKASWAFLLCGVSTVNLSVSWEDDMTGAPAGAVAHYQVVATAIGTYDMWTIEQDDATDNYKFVVDFDQTWTCSSSSQPSDAAFTLTIPGRNPSTSGCYGVKVFVVEVGGAIHDATTGRNFSAGTTCTPTSF